MGNSSTESATRHQGGADPHGKMDILGSPAVPYWLSAQAPLRRPEQSPGAETWEVGTWNQPQGALFSQLCFLTDMITDKKKKNKYLEANRKFRFIC